MIMIAEHRGRPLGLCLTGGQHYDNTQARTLGEAWTAISQFCLISDWAYDVNAFRA